MSALQINENHGSSALTGEALTCPFTLDIYASAHTASNGLSQSTDSITKAAVSNSTRDAFPPPLPAAILETLPTIMHSTSPEHTVIEIKDEIRDYLSMDLNVDRLNAIHGRMWMCGRPLNARGLHRQHMMNRRIVHTEQADLHLLYYNDVLFIKPLPAYILCPETWTQYLNKEEKLHKNACGFLLSYIWLIRSPLDFHLAGPDKAHLLPPGLTWTDWKTIVNQFLKVVDANALDQVNKRYHFGELRLGRINTIYRLNPAFFFTHFVRGYLYGYNRYALFFQRNVGWVLVVFVWFSLILSAMQVGAAVKELSGNVAFNRASYGFVIFSMAMVAVVLAFVCCIFVAVFVYNMFAAIDHSRKESNRRHKLAKHRKGE